MKKAVQLLLVVAMIATSASAVFADAKINAWGRGIFAPAVSNNAGETVPTNGVSWSGDWGGAPRIGWTINAQDKDGNVGFKVDMNSDGQSAGFQDEQKIWAKPIPILTVEIGPSVFYQTLRGDAAFGAWNYMRFTAQNTYRDGDEDVIFARGKAGKGDAWAARQNPNGVQGGGSGDTGIYGGAIIHLDTQGIHVFASLDQGKDTVVNVDDNGTPDDPDDDITTTEIYTSSIMLKRGQYGVGYEIPNVGLARVQYIGKAYVPTDVDDLQDAIDDEALTDYGVINAAVKLDKLVPNLYVDLGTFIPTASREDCGEYKEVNVYAKYTMGNMTFHFTAQTKLDMLDPEGDGEDEKLGFHIGAGADIGIGNGLTINADIRYFDKVWMQSMEGNASIGLLGGVAKGFSNGKIAAGFQYVTKEGTLSAPYVVKEEPDDAMWAIPIVIEYWF
jgi:opacity protein-like surface antigen